MWFEIIFLTLCVLVSSQKEKLKHQYTFDTFDEEFNYRYCDGDFPWIPTEYTRQGVVPFNGNNSKCIQATSESCATSYPIDFTRGAIELNVYLQLLENNSGLTVTVFNENNVPVVKNEVNRLKDDYTQGWNTILMHVEHDMVGYLNLKGRSNKEEIILVDSVQYSEYVYTGKRQYYEQLQIRSPFAMKLSEKLKTSARKAESESKIIDLKSETSEKYSKNRFRRSIDTSEGTTQSPKYSVSDEKGDLDQGKTTAESSMTSESIPTETGNSGSETVTSTTKDLDSNQTDNPDQDSINTTSSPTTVPDLDSESSPTETGNTDSETVTSTTKDPDSNQTDNPDQDNSTTQTNNPEQDSTNTTSSPTTVPDSDSESSPIETGNTDSETVTSATKDPDSNQTDNPDQDNNTTQTNNPEQDSTNTTSTPTTVSDSDSSTQDQQNNFTWSPFTITLVAVGSFVALSVTAVSAYYCGKIRAQRDDTNFILDQVEDIKPQPIIPRVRNAKRVEV